MTVSRCCSFVPCEVPGILGVLRFVLAAIAQGFKLLGDVIQTGRGDLSGIQCRVMERDRPTESGNEARLQWIVRRPCRV